MRSTDANIETTERESVNVTYLSAAHCSSNQFHSFRTTHFCPVYIYVISLYCGFYLATSTFLYELSSSVYAATPPSITRSAAGNAMNFDNMRWPSKQFKRRLMKTHAHLYAHPTNTTQPDGLGYVMLKATHRPVVNTRMAHRLDLALFSPSRVRPGVGT
jgi:hypothetical protein